MKFLADENVEMPIVKFLCGHGYDVVHVAENMHGCSDEEVLALASAEARILITNDTDFGEMVFRQKWSSAGIILMRFTLEKSASKIEVLQHLLRHHSEKLYRHFVTVNECQIKIKPL